jgi:hypothetical protein
MMDQKCSLNRGEINASNWIFSVLVCIYASYSGGLKFKYLPGDSLLRLRFSLGFLSPSLANSGMASYKQATTTSSLFPFHPYNHTTI